MEYSSSENISDIRNTYTGSIGVSYTHVSRSGLLLSGTADIGQEKYKLVMLFPFQNYGFIVPPRNELSKYTFEQKVPYARIGVNVGYRLNFFSKIQPEIRIGQSINLPFAEKSLYTRDVQHTRTGFDAETYVMTGHFGKSGNIGAEFITTAYVGINLKSKLHPIKGYSIGMLFQKNMLTPDHLNSFSVEYGDYFGQVRSKEVFKGKHRTISLTLGVNF